MSLPTGVVEPLYPSPSYGDFANRLLDRPPQPEYLTMWGELLMHAKAPMPGPSEGSVLLFRLGNEWFGFSTSVLEEVLESRPIHTVPNSRSKIFLGVVNVRGQLRLCIALHKLLEVSSEWTAAPRSRLVPIFGMGHRKYQRMMAIKRSTEMWVFPVDEVYGAISCTVEGFLNLPVNVSKSTVNYLKGLWRWNDRNVAVIDEELLFASLRRMIP